MIYIVYGWCNECDGIEFVDTDFPPDTIRKLCEARGQAFAGFAERIEWWREPVATKGLVEWLEWPRCVTLSAYDEHSHEVGPKEPHRALLDLLPVDFWESFVAAAKPYLTRPEDAACVRAYLAKRSEAEGLAKS